MRQIAAVLLAVLAAVAAGVLTPQSSQAAGALPPPCPLDPALSLDYPPVGPEPKVLGTETIGAIGLKTPIFMGDWPDMSTEASHTLMYGPAFYPLHKMVWTNHLPGHGDTVGMAGHRTTRTHPNCFMANVRRGNFAVIKMRYGTFTYREVRQIVLPAQDDSAFIHPQTYDPRPHQWNPGITPEYLVDGGCDPPGQASSVRYLIFKLVKAIFERNRIKA